MPSGIDWSSLTAEEILAALKSAPGVMGPWIDDGNGDWHRDQKLPHAEGFAAVESYSNGTVRAGLYVTGINLRLGNDYASAEEAKAAVDARLVECGWKLCK
jgi:hypothetical protein